MQDKRTVLALAEALAAIIGTPASTLRQISRLTREAGFLSQNGHGQAGATATSRDAATLLLVSMATDTARHAGPVVEALSALERDESDFEGTPAPETLAGLKCPSTDLIGVVTEIIDGHRWRDENFKGIGFIHMSTRVDRHATAASGPFVAIYWGNDDDMDAWNFHAPEDSPALAGYQRVSRQRSTRGLRRIVDADGWILVALADWLEGREVEQ